MGNLSYTAMGSKASTERTGGQKQSLQTLPTQPPPEPSPETWCGVSKLPCAAHSSKYRFTLHVEEVFSVAHRTARISGQPVSQQQHSLLFHGTTWENMKSIIANDFRLPTRAGMFGKGIYFDTPLKSWQ